MFHVNVADWLGFGVFFHHEFWDVSQFWRETCLLDRINNWMGIWGGRVEVGWCDPYKQSNLYLCNILQWKVISETMENANSGKGSSTPKWVSVAKHDLLTQQWGFKGFNAQKKSSSNQGKGYLLRATEETLIGRSWTISGYIYISTNHYGPLPITGTTNRGPQRKPT